MAPLGGPSIQALGFRILVLVCMCVCCLDLLRGGGGRFVIFCNPETPLSLQKQQSAEGSGNARLLGFCWPNPLSKPGCRIHVSGHSLHHVGTGVAGIMLYMSKPWPFLPRLQVQKSS